MRARKSRARLFRNLAITVAAYGVMTAPAAAQTPAAAAARANLLIERAIAELATAEPSDSHARPRIAETLMRLGRCDEALQLLGGHPSAESMIYERLAQVAKESGQPTCIAYVARGWAAWVRSRGRTNSYLLNQAGAYLRISGHDAEGQALIDEAAAALADLPRTRSSQFWSHRWAALRIYEGTPLFDTELDRAVADLLASPPSPDRPMLLPVAGSIVTHLQRRGDGEIARQVAEAVCSANAQGTWRCGASGSDAEMARFHTPAGQRLRAFSVLISDAQQALFNGQSDRALALAREAMAMEISRGDLDRHFSGNPRMWHHLHAQLAGLFVAIGAREDLAALLRRARPDRDSRAGYDRDMAVGYAQQGDSQAVERLIQRIPNPVDRRHAWRMIASDAPRVPVSQRSTAIERMYAIVVPPSNRPPGGHPTGANCGEVGGGMLALDGAPVETILRFASRSQELAGDRCAYRAFILSAAQRIEASDDRAPPLARELLRTTERICLYPCDSLEVLGLLIQIGLDHEAEMLALRFREGQRVTPLTMLAEALAVPRHETEGAR